MTPSITTREHSIWLPVAFKTASKSYNYSLEIVLGWCFKIPCLCFSSCSFEIWHAYWWRCNPSLWNQWVAQQWQFGVHNSVNTLNIFSVLLSNAGLLGRAACVLYIWSCVGIVTCCTLYKLHLITPGQFHICLILNSVPC